jgi:hypothetical protein
MMAPTVWHGALMPIARKSCGATGSVDSSPSACCPLGDGDRLSARTRRSNREAERLDALVIAGEGNERDHHWSPHVARFPNRAIDHVIL